MNGLHTYCKVAVHVLKDCTDNADSVIDMLVIIDTVRGSFVSVLRDLDAIDAVNVCG